MSLPLHCEQLRLIADLAASRTPFWDPIFRFLNYADSSYFVFVLIPLVWVGFSWRWGLRLFYLVTISTLLNAFFKELIGWPRPCTDAPEVGMLCIRGFGFPSGGAQTCMLLGGLLIYTWRTRAAWVLGVLYIALVSFSRLYLGVHYPIDILGGWAIGLALLGLYIWWIGPIERFLHSKRLETGFVLSEVFPLLLMLGSTSSLYHRVDAMAVGLGAFLSLKYHLYLPAPKTIQAGLIRGTIAVIGLFLILAVLPPSWPISVKYAILALWLSLGASPACRVCRAF